jgi:hypothetical protein
MYRKGKDRRKMIHLAVFVPSVFGEKFPTAEFGMIAETSCWEIERK